jgi:iron complex outermembrane receptor protein
MTSNLRAPLCRPHAIALAIAMAPFVSSASAAEAVLPTVTVKALREGGPMLGSRAASLPRAATGDTASLLRDVPGVSLGGAGGVSSLPSIRGLGDDRLRIQVDGMDLIASCPNHMNPPLSYLDPQQVEALTVYPGVAPVSLGGDSIGGTVVARTRSPRFASAQESTVFEGEVGGSVRSNDHARGAHLSLLHATESFQVAYRGATRQADNGRAAEAFKTSTATGRVGHTLALDEIGSTAYKTGNHALDLAWKSAEHVLELKLGYQDMPLQLFPNQRMDLLENTQARANLRYTGSFSWGHLEARAYHERVDHAMDFGPDKRFWYGTLSGMGQACAPIRFMGDPAGSCAAGMPMLSEGRTSGAALKADWTLDAHSLLRVGAEMQRYGLNDWWPASGGGMGPGTFWNVRDGRRDRSAAFLEWEGKPSDGWQTVVGARYERLQTDAGPAAGYRTAAPDMGAQVAEAAAFNARPRRRTDGNWDLSAINRYTVNAELDVELGLARKVRSPNLYERYTWSTWAMAASMNNTAGDGNGYVGNADLKPEIATTAALTLDGHATDRRWSWSVTPYITHVTDYIDAVPTTGWAPNQFNVLRYANQSARLHGLDLAAQAPLGDTAWGAWGVQARASYTRGQNRVTGAGLYNVMPLNGKLTLTHKVGRWDNRVEVEGVAAKDRRSQVRNEIRTAGYGLVHLRSSRAWSQVRVEAGVENLFDRAHALPTGGAYVGQGMTMSINGVPWGVAVPGVGRSVYLGLIWTL